MASGVGSLPVSVVVPCYCCEATIERTLKSVLLQTAQPVEIIMVEDWSQDGTLGLLREFERQYPGWVKVLALERNLGAADARNAGWEIASQPYIAFLDSDDSWHAEKLARQFGYMNANPNVVLSGHQCVNAHGDPIPSLVGDEWVATEIPPVSLLFRNAFSTPSVMLKRDIPFRFMRGKRHSEDLLLWQQIAYGGFRVTRIEVPLAFVHKPFYGSGGLSSSLWKMELGELNNFAVLYRAHAIGAVLYFAASAFSVFKFVVRALKLNLRWSKNARTNRQDR